jgi:hypothetical protein
LFGKLEKTNVILLELICRSVSQGFRQARQNPWVLGEGVQKNVESNYSAL